MLQAPLLGRRLQEPHRPLHALVIQSRIALPERRPELVPRHVSRRRRVLHGAEEAPVEVPVSVGYV